MKTVKITAPFDGYPNGKDERHFAKDEEATLSNAFADLIIGKGLATEIPGTAQDEPEPEPETNHEAEPPAEPEQKDTAA